MNVGLLGTSRKKQICRQRYRAEERGQAGRQAGKDRTGQDRTGQDRIGQDRIGQDRQTDRDTDRKAGKHTDRKT